MASPELSIIIPTLNEVSTIQALIDSLINQQQPPNFEIIVADGGSLDGTLGLIEVLAAKHGHKIHGIAAPVGRARQMNAGARQAQGKTLFFLHADTVITDPLLLYHANLDIESAQANKQHNRVAGHFGLHFIRKGSDHQFAYYFYECKTRLNRPGCINGDQGMWVSRGFFDTLGGFDESLTYMEDARFACEVLQKGEWITLSGCVFTSARRFESEGLKPRQTLNALLCAVDAIGLQEFFQHARLAYQTQGNTQRLKLSPFFKKLHQLCWATGYAQGLVWWWRAGVYAASNSWQLAFALDCRHGFKKGVAVSDIDTPLLRRHDRYLKRVIESKFGRLIAMVLSFVWFYSRLLMGK